MEAGRIVNCRDDLALNLFVGLLISALPSHSVSFPIFADPEPHPSDFFDAAILNSPCDHLSDKAMNVFAIP